jgi:hypothetical protein
VRCGGKAEDALAYLLERDLVFLRLAELAQKLGVVPP